jgi:hypothetical protein
MKMHLKLLESWGFNLRPYQTISLLEYFEVISILRLAYTGILVNLLNLHLRQLLSLNFTLHYYYSEQ